MMSDRVDALVIGLGEIGKPLLDILSLHYDAHGRDLEPTEVTSADVIHLCFPWSEDFVEQTMGYVEKYDPELCIIHSTVVPYTTRYIRDCFCFGQRAPFLSYSPIRGRHGQMHRDLMHYRKFVGGIDEQNAIASMTHLARAGFDVRGPVDLEALELAKLIETTYSALLIAWAQEMERYAEELGVSRVEALCLTEEPPYLPDHLFHPGVIGGHCLMQNLALLDSVQESLVTEFIRQSNEKRREEIGESDVRHTPERIR